MTRFLRAFFTNCDITNLTCGLAALFVELALIGMNAK